jgi:concentrative nucleoside transporter, CNT family
MPELGNLQSLTGIFGIMAICWLLSEARGRFPFRLMIGSLLVQGLLVLVLFGLPQARSVLSAINAGVEALGAATQSGTTFVFGYLAGQADAPYVVARPQAMFVFAFRVLPVILVVCALSALLWHWRILKWITRSFGVLFQKTLGLRGPPALATAATIFMGQVEGPIFIRAYLDRLTRSELFTLMSVGLACVSGSTMVAYVTILKDVLPNAGAHILTASIISAPAGVLLARIIVPADRSESLDDVQPDDDRNYDSSIDAVIRGTGDGLTVLLNVAATLIVFVAFMALLDKILTVIPPVAGGPVTVERVLGYAFQPLAYAIGIPWSEAHAAGGLLGVKLVLTEFTAFFDLSAFTTGPLSPHSRIIMTYALCGFGNIASVGITVSGFSVLVPERRKEIIGLAWKALVAGFLATCMTAAVVGLAPPALFTMN